ncbi:MAG: spore maturation protein [Candidatus Syntrophonatronum acetioxidans]|uniref:Spore maturation protein n=1 Tax=Candidatus Syntrophonatronum acetioxidans TaxID=1795816 RepID=A0A424YFL6_9FIRM|nr:MAG: spore maturation protein [Candidatus Syntrophonatronum acetioxidans]
MVSHFINVISVWTIPAIILVTLSYAHWKGVKVFDVFTEGAKEGFETAVKLIPFMVAMLAAIGLFRRSGALEILINLLSPLFNYLGIPTDILPLAVMRPISGSSALAITTELLKTHGPDSMIGRIASTMMGSTETTLYTLTLYFGTVGIKKIRHSLTVGLIADLSGLLAAIIICNKVFGP